MCWSTQFYGVKYSLLRGSVLTFTGVGIKKNFFWYSVLRGSGIHFYGGSTKKMESVSNEVLLNK